MKYDSPIPDDIPIEKPIIFLAGEWGCVPKWYRGFAWKSDISGIKLYVYPETLGFSKFNPPFNAPPYWGEWKYPRGVSYQPTLFDTRAGSGA